MEPHPIFLEELHVLLRAKLPGVLECFRTPHEHVATFVVIREKAQRGGVKEKAQRGGTKETLTRWSGR